METIYIGFSHPISWFEPFSWAIRLMQWTSYSHVYIRVHSNELDRDIVYQASGLQVNFIGLNRFKTKEVIVKEFPLQITPETKKQVLQYCTDMSGASYGVLEVLGYPWVMINSLFGRQVHNPFGSTTSFVCSQFIGNILKDDLGDSLPNTNTLDPKQIYQYLSNKK